MSRDPMYATNGVLRMIDHVLIPLGVTIPPNLLDLIKSFLDLSMLVTALEAARLDAPLTGQAPYSRYTVFAPTSCLCSTAEWDIGYPLGQS